MKKHPKKGKSAPGAPEWSLTNGHVFGLLAVLTLACYFNSLRGGFVFDDWPMIVYNQKIRSIEHVPGYFTAGGWKSTQLELEDRALYRPFYLLSIFFTYKIWGLDPVGFHLTNVFLHFLNSCLVFLIIRRLLPDEGMLPALLATLIFVAHPVHTESVSWISGITDMLFTCLLLISFLFYVDQTGSKRPLFFAGALAFFVFALLTKETAIVYPAILVAYDFLKTRRLRYFQIGAFVMAGMLYFIVRRLVLGGYFGTLSLSSVDILRLIAYPAGYIRLLVAPWPIRYFFETPIGAVVGSWGLVVAGCALGAAVVFAARTKDVSAFGLVWIFVTLLPPLSLAFLPEPAYGSFGNRFLYLPSVGFSIFAAAVAARALKINLRRTVIAFCTYAFALGLVAVWANRDWRSDGTFFSKALKYNPNHFGVHFNMARFDERTGQTEDALRHYRKALDCLAPTQDKVAALSNMAALYGQTGRREESIRHYLQALRLDPGNSAAHNGLGNNAYLQKDYVKALTYYRKAYELDGSNHEACYNVAMTLDKLGDSEEATLFYRRFLQRAPDAEYAAVKRRVRALLENRK